MSEIGSQTNGQARALVVARLLLVMIFYASGIEKLFRYDMVLGFAASYQIPFGQLVMPVVVAFELLGATAILVGWKTKPIALLFVLFIAFVGPWFHRFWNADWVANPIGAQQITDDFFHHVTMAGGFLCLAVWGPGKLSLDAKLQH